ncbi:MAG TPA: hypothetical protein PLE81_12685 [Brevundimonas sp.]|jgi:hypothetical protein|uniref:hypothetical protein n=1 Tax=Brevundimonas sp. TaxID=1871086 RepID=UPI002C9979BD|nr:hypothetical protein [Brevundimonas sp.]HRH21479.1 hypothetical protein [Brevundimonas sp.]
MSAQTEIRDFVIWHKHLHGDPTLAARVAALRPGQTIRLAVDGVAGSWRKMDQGKDGRPTPGIRPLGAAQQFWRELYKSRRGAVVSVSLIDDADGGTDAHFEARPDISSTERDAALSALLAMRGQGWASDGTPFDRDTAHER